MRDTSDIGFVLLDLLRPMIHFWITDLTVFFMYSGKDFDFLYLFGSFPSTAPYYTPAVLEVVWQTIVWLGAILMEEQNSNLFRCRSTPYCIHWNFCSFKYLLRVIGFFGCFRMPYHVGGILVVKYPQLGQKYKIHTTENHTRNLCSLYLSSSIS